MVHTAKNKTLGRKAEARKALLTALSNALIQQKHITTTLAKAKTLARFIAPIITKARNQATSNVHHAYMHAFAKLRNKQSTQTLFNEILPKTKERQGGYTRIIKLSPSQKGNNAKQALIELVDFNPLLQAKKPKTRRSRRKSSVTQQTATSKDALPKKNMSPIL